jgi:glycosyltransferase involved in cell wall biosynthesis
MGKDALLGGAYAFLYPADDHGASGMPLPEAMATGTPVVATDGNPPSELVRDGVTGFVCASLGEHGRSREGRCALDRKASRAHAARSYSPATLARAYEKVYMGLLDSPDTISGRVRRPSTSLTKSGGLTSPLDGLVLASTPTDAK